MQVRTFGIIALCLLPRTLDTTNRLCDQFDLAIIHASVLDVHTGRVLGDRTVLVRDGIISAVTPSSSTAPSASRIIDAHDRLLTPGLIDAHLHTFLILPDSLVMTPDSIEAYRRTLAQAYLPYGVTAVRDVGSSERWMPMLLKWMERTPIAPDFYPSGAHLISREAGRTPLAHQIVVEDSAAAAAKVRAYYALGIRNIKLYWRLREPEFKGALFEAQNLQMNVTGHIDQQVMTIDRALDLGLRNFEHVHTFAYSVMTTAGFDSLMAEVPTTLGIKPPRFPPTALYMNVPEFWNYLGPQNAHVLALVAKFKADDASLTPTLHVLAQRLGLAYFQSAPRDSTENTAVWTALQRARTIAGYRIMASYVKRMYDAGIRLNLGTDAHDAGKAALSEMLLLHDAGIPMTGVFRIATLDTAQDIGHESEYGSIEVGKRADLILFDADPLASPRDLLGTKTVIKDGVVWSGSN